MPYCSECGYEYREGTSVCPDCRNPLTPGVRLVCSVCSEPVGPGSTFCTHCGAIQAGALSGAALPRCEEHRDRPAAGCCVICRRVLCRACSRMRNGRMFCDNDEHVKSAFRWVVAATRTTVYEAEMIRANLEGAEIPSMLLPQADRMYVTTVGDLAVVEVMVPAESLEEAQDFIRALESGELPPVTE